MADGNDAIVFLFNYKMVSRTASPAKRAASPKKSPAKRAASPKKRSPSRKASPKKRKATKKPAAHPKYSEMIVAAIKALKQRGGSSRQAIAKYVTSNYKVRESSNVHLRLAIRRGVAAGTFVPVKGSFKLSDAAKKPPAKPKKAKKPKAKKAKKPKKKTAAKKKKPVKKAKKAAGKKSKSKAKKPAKKAKRPVAKKPAAKKAKKSGAKKAKKSAKR